MTFAVPLAERFASCIEVVPNGCWRWTGCVAKNGYAVISAEPEVGRRRARQLKAHRVSFEFFGGVIGAGDELDHVCHTLDMDCPGGPTCLHRRCVNPSHLEAVTHAENTLRGVPARKLRCAQGHEFTPENTRPRAGTNKGKRICIVCASAAAAKYRAATRHGCRDCGGERPPRRQMCDDCRLRSESEWRQRHIIVQRQKRAEARDAKAAEAA